MFYISEKQFDSYRLFVKKLASLRQGRNQNKIHNGYQNTSR